MVSVDLIKLFVDYKSKYNLAEELQKFPDDASVISNAESKGFKQFNRKSGTRRTSNSAAKGPKGAEVNLEEAVKRQRLELESKQLALQAAQLDKQLATTKYETAKLQRLTIEQGKVQKMASASSGPANPLVSPQKQSPHNHEQARL